MTNKPDFKSLPKEIYALAVLILLQILFVLLLFWQNGLFTSPKDEFSIAYMPTERIKTQISPFGPGLETQIIADFCRSYDFKARWLSTNTWREALDAFYSGDADLLIVPGLNPGKVADLPQTHSGPSYADYSGILIHNKYRYGLSAYSDMCKYPILCVDDPLTQSFLNNPHNLECAPKTVLSDHSSIKDLLQKIADNQARFGFVDEGRLIFWEPFFTRIRRTHRLPTHGVYRWYWRTSRPEFNSALQEFWEQLPENKDIAELRDKYLGFFPDKPDYYELNHFFKTLEEKLPRYQKTISQTSREYGLDPLFLVALIYQESHFKAQASSKTGVRGLLQITKNTAKELGLKNRLDPHASIRGGTKYLKYLWQRLEGRELSPWNRWFYALAAYNQGFGHLTDAMALAQKLGKNPRSWNDLKTVYPLLSSRKYYQQVKHGYARGHEAVDYVDSIRYYYYILHGLVVLARPEMEHLAHLLATVNSPWP